MQNYTSEIKVCLFNYKTPDTRVGAMLLYTLLNVYVTTNVAISRKWKGYFPSPGVEQNACTSPPV